MAARRLLLPALVALLALSGATAAYAARPQATAPAAERIGFQVAGAHRVGGDLLALAGRRLRIDGRTVPNVPGQRVTVRIWRGHKLLKQAVVRTRPSSTGRTARFILRFTPERTGDLQVFAIRTAPGREKLVAKAALAVLAPAAGPGARGPFVALLQQRLAAVGYAVPRTGVYDAGTERAVLAFRKVNGMARIATLEPLIVDRLMRGVGGYRVRYPKHGRHVEANLSQQVLALIEGGKVVRAYHTSSGAPATPTVTGSYRFYLKTPGTNAKGMVHSAFFIRGYAIHGYASVPTYNASHGCLRVPIPDAWAIFTWVRLGDRIDVYY